MLFICLCSCVFFRALLHFLFYRTLIVRDQRLIHLVRTLFSVHPCLTCVTHVVTINKSNCRIWRRPVDNPIFQDFLGDSWERKLALLQANSSYQGMTKKTIQFRTMLKEHREAFSLCRVSKAHQPNVLLNVNRNWLCVDHIMKRAFPLLSAAYTRDSSRRRTVSLLFASNMSCNVRFLALLVESFYDRTMAAGMNLIWYHLNERRAPWSIKRY